MAKPTISEEEKELIANHYHEIRKQTEIIRQQLSKDSPDVEALKQALHLIKGSANLAEKMLVKKG
jgi:hypothetical protein